MDVGKVNPKLISDIFGIRDVDDFKLDFKYRGFRITVIGDNQSPMKAVVSDEPHIYFNGQTNKINIRCLNEVIGRLKRLVDDIKDDIYQN